MNDPERLRDLHAGKLEGLLLESSRVDAAPPVALQRTMRAVAFSASMAGAAAAGSSSASAAAHAPVGVLIAAKWALVGATAAAVSLGIGHRYVDRSTFPVIATTKAVPAMPLPEHGTSRHEVPEQVAATVSSPTEVAPFVASAPSVASTASVAPSASVAPPRSPTLGAREGTGSAAVSLSPGWAPAESMALAPKVSRPLAEEVTALDAARRALASGEPRRAMGALDAYERDFPAANLAPEAVVLRIQALVQSGDRAGATEVGGAFLTANPHSPHADRVRALLAGTSK